MDERKFKISKNQVTWLIFAIAPVGLTSLPRDISQYTGQSGWITIIVASILILAVMSMLILLAKRYPGQSILIIFKKVAGKWFGSFLFLILTLYMVIGTGISIRILVDGVITHVLLNTPHGVLIFILILSALYPVIKGVETITRFNEILQPLILITFLFICLLAIKDVDFSEFKPIISLDFKPVKGLLLSSYPFFYVLSLLFFFPYIKNYEALKKGLYLGIGWVGFEALVLFLMVVGLFGTVELQYIQYPSIELARIIEFPLFERMEILFLQFWIVYSYSLIAVTFFAGIKGFQSLFSQSRKWIWVVIVSVIVFIIAILPNNLEMAAKVASIQNYINLFFLFIFFPALLLINTVKKKVGKNESLD